MDKNIEISQLKQMESPVGESVLFKSLCKIGQIAFLGLLALVIFMTINAQIPLFAVTILSAFIGSLIGGIFVAKRLLTIVSHQAKYINHESVKARIVELET